METKAGVKTSEFYLTAIAMVIGTILEAVAVPLLERLAATNPQLGWVPFALIAAGALIQVAGLFGYQKSRADVKAAAAAAGVAAGAGQPSSGAAGTPISG